ncbi:MAG: DNA translocase FtsK 4TM domain-containing protein, partial [Pedobacter sp.]|nr:DNA translocase FtsK 4TM domain-containing protein [Pedobacter sp.]
MSVRGNQFKSNSFKQENDPSTGQKSSATRSQRPKVDVMPSFDLKDGRFIKIIGLLFIIISIYFLVAFTSYLFTWQEDQSYVIDANGGWANLLKTGEELKSSGVTAPVVENWLGKIGALLAHQFIYEWFGVASFLFVLMFFVIGYRLLFKVKIFAIEKTLAYSFFFIIFISLT